MHKVVRGCGRRQKGGTYITIPTGERGVPLDDFLPCPPRPVDAERLRIEPIGVQLIDVGGVTHVFDWVGSTHYPNVADMIAEMRRYGVSRRIATNTDFSRLSKASKLFLLHARALIRNAGQLRSILRDDVVERRPEATGWSPLAGCPARRMEHMAIPVEGPQPDEMCQALYWEDVEGGETVLDPQVPWRSVDRTVGSTTYRARRRPDGFTPDYQLGIFAILPIHHLTVINDPEGGRHIAALERARRSGLPVEIENE